MTSNELNEILNKTRRTPNISLTPEQVEELIKDLEDYEELKNLMGTPIQDIMKRLKILKLLKNIIAVVPNTKDTSGPKYYIEIRQDVILNDETKEIIKEWLDEIRN